MTEKTLEQPPISAVMGPGTCYKGDLTFEGRVRVDGEFEGRIYTEELLEVGLAGVVKGEFDVARAVVAGTIEGNLRVRERLVLESTARVRGKLDAGIVEMRDGAQIDAQVRIHGKELP